jgi:hypothetical protein
VLLLHKEVKVMTNEQAFFRIIQDYSKGVEVKGKSAYIRLMQLKSRYYQETLPSIKDEINQLLPHIPEYREEIFHAGKGSPADKRFD